MSKNIIAAAFLVSIFVSGTLYAGPGGSAAAFLKIGVGARPTAMGEAYAGIKGDILSIYSNPAGISSLVNYNFSFTHAFWFEGINYSNFVAGAPMLDGYMALGVNGIFYGEIEKYDRYGDKPDDTYSPSDMAFSLSYASDDLLDSLSFGGTFKLITSHIDDESATAVAMDMGVMREIGNINAGFSLQNMGTEMKYRNEGDPLPFTARLGASYPFRAGDFDMVVSAETNYSADIPLRANAGINADYPVNDFLLSLRVGLKSYAEWLHALSHLTTGFGVKYDNMTLDYSVASFEDLGLTHRISTGYRFR